MSDAVGGRRKTALVCGAGGFIGSHLVKRLVKEGYWVRGSDQKATAVTFDDINAFAPGVLQRTAD